MNFELVRSNPRPRNAEEGAIKKKTDCVYFLASRMTCKKGSDCGYRHSDGARLNPKDCRFWLSGKCLNPKCTFRHPPLDRMTGSPRITSGQIAASQASPSVQLPSDNSFTRNSSRKFISIHCYYYRKGACLKGGKCSFMHGPQPASNPVPKYAKKGVWETNGCSNLHNSSALKADNKDCTVKPVNNPTSNTNCHLANISSHSLPHNLCVQAEDHLLNEREDGEIFKEPSTEFLKDSSLGFDVLVNHDARDADYFEHKDAYQNGFINHPDKPSTRLNGIPDFVVKEPNDDEWDQRGVCFSSSEKILDKLLLLNGRRLVKRVRSPEDLDETDLRNLLLKQRRCHLRESTASSRLRGRIALPKLPPPEFPSNFQNGRVSRRRLRWRPSKNSFANARQSGRRQKTRDSTNLLDFAGPKTLADLKVGAKSDENSHAVSAQTNVSASSPEHNEPGSLKTAARHQYSDASAEFDAPQPLCAFLQTEREANPEVKATAECNPEELTAKEGKILADTEEMPREKEEADAEDETETKDAAKDETETKYAAEDETETKDAAEDEQIDYAAQRDDNYDDTVDCGDCRAGEIGMDPMNADIDTDEDEMDFATKIALIFA